MAERILRLLEQAGGVISLAGVLVIAGGFLWASSRYATDWRARLTDESDSIWENNPHWLKHLKPAPD
jgi:hypothetical protein